MKKKETGSGIVYSTEHGRMCPECGKPAADCSCTRKSTACRGDGTVRVGLVTAGRRGKDVTIITGIPLDDAGLKELGRQLKSKCGSGGTVKDGVIEIQGDHRTRLPDELESRGWTVKRDGGGK